MEKPVKKDLESRESGHYVNGYNQACDDWEKWLPEVLKYMEPGEQLRLCADFSIDKSFALPSQSKQTL